LRKTAIKPTMNQMQSHVIFKTNQFPKIWRINVREYRRGNHKLENPEILAT